MEGIEPVTDLEEDEPPPSCAAKCTSLHHIMSTFGRLQIAQIVRHVLKLVAHYSDEDKPALLSSRAFTA